MISVKAPCFKACPNKGTVHERCDEYKQWSKEYRNIMDNKKSDAELFNCEQSEMGYYKHLKRYGRLLK